MTRPRVYVAFDYDDVSVKGDLIAQARRADCPFQLDDCSIEKPIRTHWAVEAERKITTADCVLILCGEQTHQAGGASTELQIAQKLGKRCIFVAGTRGGVPTAPVGTPSGTRIWTWTWAVVADLLADRTPPAHAVRRIV